MRSSSVRSRSRNPELLSIPQTGARDLWAALEPRWEPMVAHIRAASAEDPNLAPLLQTPDPERDATSRRLIAAALRDGEWEAYWSDVRAQAAGYALADIPFSTWSGVISALRTVAAAFLEDAYGEDPQRRAAARAALDGWLDTALGEFGDVFTSTMGDVIHRQQEAIRELSTPVLQVRPQLLIV